MKWHATFVSPACHNTGLVLVLYCHYSSAHHDIVHNAALTKNTCAMKAVAFPLLAACYIAAWHTGTASCICEDWLSSLGTHCAGLCMNQLKEASIPLPLPADRPWATRTCVACMYTRYAQSALLYYGAEFCGRHSEIGGIITM